LEVSGAAYEARFYAGTGREKLKFGDTEPAIAEMA